MQIGGYDGEGTFGDFNWVSLREASDFKIHTGGVYMNNHWIAGSETFTNGFIDSGTTFTFLPTALFGKIRDHFRWFCGFEGNCMGKILSGNTREICFEYKKEWSRLDFFKSYPVLKFQL